MNFSEAFNVYRELVLSSQTRREITSELGRWENHISPVLGGYELDKIKNLQILQLKKTLEIKKLSPQSIYHCLSLVRRVLRRAEEWELYPGPVPRFRMPKFDNRRLRFLTPPRGQPVAQKAGGTLRPLAGCGGLCRVHRLARWRDLQPTPLRRGHRKRPGQNLRLQKQPEPGCPTQPSRAGHRPEVQAHVTARFPPFSESGPLA